MQLPLELIDLESGNVVGSYAALDEALAIIRATHARHGESGIMGLALLEVGADGSQRLVAEDFDLLRLIALPGATQST